MKALLLVFALTIKSSYVENIERESTAAFDTVQFVLVQGQAWRVKTYAIDKDVHVWSLGAMSAEALEELAIANTAKNYGDVLQKTTKVEPDNDSPSSFRLGLKNAGLSEYIEYPKDESFIFWVPEPDVYRTKSSPKS